MGKQNPGATVPAGALRPVLLPDDSALQRIAGAFGQSVAGLRLATAFLEPFGQAVTKGAAAEIRGQVRSELR